MPFIRRVRVQSPGTRNEHITAVQYSTTPSSSLTLVSTEGMVRVVDSGTAVYSHHDATSARAVVITRSGISGRRHLTTVANGRETDNLLALPRF